MSLRNCLVLLGLMLTFLILMAGFGCGGAKTSTTSPAPPTTSTSGVSLVKDIQPIFNSSCVVCHQGAGQGGLTLEPGKAYTNLVGVKSIESPLMRVSPGSPDNSYLLNKLQGTQTQVGGSGLQMPSGAPPLSSAQISLIQQWISQGALNN